MADFRQLVGKRVIMTGGAGNIGRASAILMAQHGATIAIGDLDIDGANETVEMIKADGGSALAVRTDVSVEDDIAAFVAAAVDFMGGIDVGFFNAGIQMSGAVEGFDADRWDRMFAVNPRHSFLMSKHTVPHLRNAGGGALVLTSSIAGVKGGPGMTAYSASKGAIVGFGRALSAELAPDNIRVNVLCPGWVDTPFNQPAIDFMGGSEAQAEVVKSIVPLGRQAAPEEMAEVVVFLASGMSSYMTNQIIIADGGIY
ncbi:MAG: SDR family NAD(P)-dependent oxidoreductase [Actinobacteria bacterium]|nr:SDR family NAD(P)-dependent oxidoreductase [Actinomycetota bacterium]